LAESLRVHSQKFGQGSVAGQNFGNRRIVFPPFPNRWVIVAHLMFCTLESFEQTSTTQ